MDAYQTWEDLLDGGKTPTSGELLRGTSPAGKPKPDDEEEDGKLEALRELLGREDVPEEIKTVVREHLKLRQDLDEVARPKGNPYGLDDRQYRLFDLPVFSKESRLEQKRERRRDEKAKLREKRDLERKLIEHKQAQARLRLQEEAKEETARRHRAIRTIEAHRIETLRELEALVAARKKARLRAFADWASLREEQKAEQKKRQRQLREIESRWALEQEQAHRERVCKIRMKRNAAERELMLMLNKRHSVPLLDDVLDPRREKREQELKDQRRRDRALMRLRENDLKTRQQRRD